jgi:hypothetical protein
MVAAKTYSIKSWLFEEEEKSTKEISFKDFATERLEAIKDATHMFVEGGTELDKYKGRGIEFRYLPGEIKFERIDSANLVEKIEVLVSGQDYSSVIFFEVGIGKTSFFNKNFFTVGADFKLRSNKPDSKLKYVNLLGEKLDNNLGVEGFVNLVFDKLKDSFFITIDDLSVVAQKRHLQLANETIDWVKSLGGELTYKHIKDYNVEVSFNIGGREIWFQFDIIETDPDKIKVSGFIPGVGQDFNFVIDLMVKDRLKKALELVKERLFKN